MYRECPAAPLPVAQDLARRIVNIPSSPQLVEGVA
jgi:perosamine synthetase